MILLFNNIILFKLYLSYLIIFLYNGQKGFHFFVHHQCYLAQVVNYLVLGPHQLLIVRLVLHYYHLYLANDRLLDYDL